MPEGYDKKARGLTTLVIVTGVLMILFGSIGFIVGVVMTVFGAADRNNRPLSYHTGYNVCSIIAIISNAFMIVLGLPLLIYLSSVISDNVGQIRYRSLFFAGYNSFVYLCVFMFIMCAVICALSVAILVKSTRMKEEYAQYYAEAQKTQGVKYQYSAQPYNQPNYYQQNYNQPYYNQPNYYQQYNQAANTQNAPQTVICPTCGARVRGGVKYCMRCGAPLL